MICTPRFFSWNYAVSGAAGGGGSVSFNFFTEQGTIVLGALQWAVVKHGPFSGRWTLESAGQTFAEANKPSALFRRFDLRSNESNLIVKARSAFGRPFDILAADERPIGAITPAHWFTRRTNITCDPSISERDQLFAFWLAALTWKRSAENQQSS